MAWLRRTTQIQIHETARAKERERRLTQAEADRKAGRAQQWNALLAQVEAVQGQWLKLEVTRILSDVQGYVLTGCQLSNFEVRLNGYTIVPAGPHWLVENGRMLGAQREFPDMFSLLTQLDTDPDQAYFQSIGQYLYATRSFAGQPRHLENLAGISATDVELEVAMTPEYVKINDFPVSPLFNMVIPAELEIFIDEYLAEKMRKKR